MLNSDILVEDAVWTTHRPEGNFGSRERRLHPSLQTLPDTATPPRMTLSSGMSPERLAFVKRLVADYLGQLFERHADGACKPAVDRE